MKSRIIVVSIILTLLLATSSGVANPGGKGDSNRDFTCGGSCHGDPSLSSPSPAEIQIDMKSTAFSGTATEVSTLEQTVLSLQLEKDTLNAQIQTLGNTTAIQQTTITQLNAQVNNTSILDGKIANLESQIVSLTSERDQWKQLANNWYGVAMEQLSVMINVLGL